MPNTTEPRSLKPPRKFLVWLEGEVKSPPLLLRRDGKRLACSCGCFRKGSDSVCLMRSLCRALDRGAAPYEFADAQHNWRIVYRVDQDAVLVLEVYAKMTRKIPDEVLERCKRRLRQYDDPQRGV